MRRMYSEKGIYDTVNKGIEEGAISAGGVSPEQEAVLNQISYDAEGDALVATTNDFMISDNTESENILMNFSLDEENNKANIGSDYAINLESNTGVTVNGQPVLTGKKLILDFENGSNKEISEAVYNDINNKVYDYIIIKNYKRANADLAFTLNLLSGTDAKYGVVSKLSYTQTGALKQLDTRTHEISLSTSPYKISVSASENSIPIVKRILLTGASGTLSSTPKAAYPEPLQFYYQVSSGNVFAPIIWETFDSGTPNWGVGYATIYASVSDTAPVKYKITYQGSSWTATAA